MSLKYEIIKEKNNKYEKNKTKLSKLSKQLVEIGRFSKTLIRGESSDNLRDVVAEEFRDLKFKRNKLNDMSSKTLKKLRVYSDKTWKFYPESISDEYGITKYDKENPVNITIDGTYDFTTGRETLAEIRRIKDQALSNVREYRRLRKELQHTEKTFKVEGMPYASKYTVYYAGGNAENGNDKFVVHMVPGEIMRLHEETKLRKIFQAKKPQTSEHHIGTELEFICKLDKFDLAKALHKAGVADYVHLTDDGSLRNEPEYPYTHELTILTPESKTREVIKAVTEVLNEVGSKVNARCGLHIHLDMRNRDREMVFNNLVKSQKILYFECTF